jgi:O-antigen ligase
MAVAETISRQSSRPWARLQTIPASVWAIGGGSLLGYLVLTVAKWPTRWLMFMLAGVVAVVVIAAGQMRRQLTTYFVIALSINVHYYLTQPEPLMYIGISGPMWFSIPLVLLPAGALAFLAILDAIAGRARLRLRFPMTTLGLMVLTTAGIATLHSAQRRFGVYAVVEMAQYFLIYLVVLNTVRTKSDVAMVIRLLMFTLGVQCVIFLLQTGTGATFTATGQISRATDFGLVRASGTVGTTPSGYAMFIEPLLFTAFALWRTRDSGMSRRVTGALAAVASVTLVLTLNRTSWMTLILGCAIVELLVRRRGIARPLSARMLVTMAAVVVMAAIVVIPLIVPRLHADHSDDWNIRKNLIQIAISMIAHNAILGVGPGAYPFHIREYATSGTSWLWVVHNEYMLIWAERGLLGFLAWLAWMRGGFRQALAASRTSERRFQALGIGCAAALIGLWWEYTLNMWPPYSCYALLWFLFGLLVAGNDIYAHAEAPADAERASADLPLRATA